MAHNIVSLFLGRQSLPDTFTCRYYFDLFQTVAEYTAHSVTLLKHQITNITLCTYRAKRYKGRHVHMASNVKSKGTETLHRNTLYEGIYGL